jgi:anion-transporting  ArsA/GET3 family ATPase
VEEKLWEQYFSYVSQLCNTNIEHFMQYVSLDSGIAEHAEYIRHGMEFKRVLARVDYFLRHIPNRNSLTFIITMNNLNILGLKELLRSILSLRRLHSTTYQRVWFDTPILRQPTWQSLQILPPVYVKRLQDVINWMKENLETADQPFQGFKDYEVQRMQRVVDWMREGSKLDSNYVIMQRADFFRFFNEHDKRRDTDFLNTFSEMREFWNECRYHAQQ